MDNELQNLQKQLYDIEQAYHDAVMYSYDEEYIQKLADAEKHLKRKLKK